MKRITSYIAAIALSLVMMFSFSACGAEGGGLMGGMLDINFGEMIEFLLHGWDGIYDEYVKAEYVAPNPRVKHNEIRENHRVTTVNNKVTDNHRVTTTKHEVTATDSAPAAEVAKTDTVD